MIVDCDGCVVRGHGCADCVVAVLLGAPPEGVDLDSDERAAIAALSAGGLVPPLRLVPVDSHRDKHPDQHPDKHRETRRAAG